jgi:Right handed beta helix region
MILKTKNTSKKPTPWGGSMKKNSAFFIGIIVLIVFACYLTLTNAKTIKQKDGTAVTVVTVKNAEQLVRAIHSNTVIKLLPGGYDLHKKAYKSANLQEGCISHINNLTIEGIRKTQIKFTTADVLATVISFKNCKQITLRNLNIGHAPPQDGCQGNVVEIADSSKIVIENCTFFGCGIQGLSIHNVTDLTCRKSVIKECSQSIMGMGKSQNVVFENCIFKDNKESVIYTGESHKILFKNCKIIGINRSPYFQDGNQYAVLTDKGTYQGELGVYESQYVNHFTDWLSDLTLEGVWISTANDYNFHCKIDKVFKDTFGNSVISEKIMAPYIEQTGSFLEVTFDASKLNFVYSGVCTQLGKLKQCSPIIQDKRFKGFIFKFTNDDKTLVTVTSSRNDFLKFLNDQKSINLDKYCKLTIDSIDLQLGTFFEQQNKYLSGQEAVRLVSQLIDIRDKVADEVYINGPEFQRFAYRGAVKENGELIHIIDLEQKLPFLGDYIYYSTFVQLKVNALTGKVSTTDSLIGESTVSKMDSELKDFIIASTQNKSIKNNGVVLGKIKSDMSLFILLQESPDFKRVKVQLFNDEGGENYLIYTVKKDTSGWVITDRQYSKHLTNQENIGD